MGHSKRTFSVINNSGFKIDTMSKKESISTYLTTIRSKETVKIVDQSIRCVLPYFPNGPTKMPVYYGIRYGAQFLIDSQREGIEKATENLTKTVVKEQVIPYVTNCLWDSVEEKIIQDKKSKALAEFSERAFKETITEIMVKGAGAL